jgi:hypothetical protein
MKIKNETGAGFGGACRIQSHGQPRQSQRHPISETKKAVGVVQMTDCFPTLQEAIGTIPSTTKKKEKKKKNREYYH